MEFLAGDVNPSWWRDVYRIKGMEVHHMGYALVNYPPPLSHTRAVEWRLLSEYMTRLLIDLLCLQPSGNQIWPVVNAFSAAGLGPWVQYGRWGTINTPGSGCCELFNPLQI